MGTTISLSTNQCFCAFECWHQGDRNVKDGQNVKVIRLQMWTLSAYFQQHIGRKTSMRRRKYWLDFKSKRAVTELFLMRPFHFCAFKPICKQVCCCPLLLSRGCFFQSNPMWVKLHRASCKFYIQCTSFYKCNEANNHITVTATWWQAVNGPSCNRWKWSRVLCSA